MQGAALTARTALFPGGWDIRQRHAEPDAKAANAAILEDLAGGATSLLLQITAPGQAGMGYGAEALTAALKGVFLDACGLALDAGENTMDAAGSLIEIWRAANVNENQRRGAFNYDPLGVLARTGTLYYPADRSCEIAAKFANDCRTMTHVTALAGRRPALSRGRRQRGPGAGGDAGDAGGLSARLRGGGPEAERGLRQDRAGAGGGRRPVPDDRQAARRPQADGAHGRGVRGLACRGQAAYRRHHVASA